MLAMIAARRPSWWSGGKGRRAGGAADDADGAGELVPVRIDVRFGGGLADQRADRVMGEQVAVYFLADHVRAFGPQHAARASQVGFELVISGFVLPAFVVCLRKQPGRRHGEFGEGGDQRDQLARAVTVAAGPL